jgi:Tfp pilus assembly protein PilF
MSRTGFWIVMVLLGLTFRSDPSFAASPPSNNAAEWERCYDDANKGNHSAAVCSQAMAILPSWEPAYSFRGAAYEKLLQNIKAIADYQKALIIDPSNIDAQNGLKRLRASPAAPGGG